MASLSYLPGKAQGPITLGVRIARRPAHRLNSGNQIATTRCYQWAEGPFCAFPPPLNFVRGTRCVQSSAVTFW